MSVEDANDVLNSLRQAYRDERAANHVLRAQLADVAAFLDLQAGRIESCAVTGDGEHPHLMQIAADCRAMAAKLRGEA